MRSPFFHAHAHSHYSVIDATQTVPEMVSRAADRQQPALALTDHGVMSGTVQLYKGAQKRI